MDEDTVITTATNSYSFHQHPAFHANADRQRAENALLQQQHIAAAAAEPERLFLIRPASDHKNLVISVLKPTPHTTTYKVLHLPVTVIHSKVPVGPTAAEASQHGNISITTKTHTSADGQTGKATVDTSSISSVTSSSSNANTDNTLFGLPRDAWKDPALSGKAYTSLDRLVQVLQDKNILGLPLMPSATSAVVHHQVQEHTRGARRHLRPAAASTPSAPTRAAPNRENTLPVAQPAVKHHGNTATTVAAAAAPLPLAHQVPAPANGKTAPHTHNQYRASVGAAGAASQRNDRIHRIIYNEDKRALAQLLNNVTQETTPALEAFDGHGNTPLVLAAMLGRYEMVHALLAAGAKPMRASAHGWTPLQEAISFQHAQVTALLWNATAKEALRETREQTVNMMTALESMPAFRLNMKWHFRSWVPLLARLAPSDAVRITKVGTLVRMDMTLLGFERMKYLRGNVSYVLNLPPADTLRRNPDARASLSVLNHGRKLVCHIKLAGPSAAIAAPPKKRGIFGTVKRPKATDPVVLRMMAHPIERASVPASLQFVPVQGGILGMGSSQKKATIQGYDTKVFVVKDVEFGVYTRTEHCVKAIDPEKKKKLVYMVGGERPKVPDPPLPDDYFREIASGGSSDKDAMAHLNRGLKEEHLGKKSDIKVWMAEKYPLDAAMVTCFLDILAGQHDHVKRLKDFFASAQFPGFPVQLDIPVYPAVSARVAFCDVEVFDDADKRSVVPVSPSFFAVPPTYKKASMQQVMTPDESS